MLTEEDDMETARRMRDSILLAWNHYVPPCYSAANRDRLPVANTHRLPVNKMKCGLDVEGLMACRAAGMVGFDSCDNGFILDISDSFSPVAVKVVLGQTEGCLSLFSAPVAQGSTPLKLKPRKIRPTIWIPTAFVDMKNTKSMLHVLAWCSVVLRFDFGLCPRIEAAMRSSVTSINTQISLVLKTVPSSPPPAFQLQHSLPLSTFPSLGLQFPNCKLQIANCSFRNLKSELCVTFFFLFYFFSASGLEVPIPIASTLNLDLQLPISTPTSDLQLPIPSVPILSLDLQLPISTPTSDLQLPIPSVPILSLDLQLAIPSASTSDLQLPIPSVPILSLDLQLPISTSTLDLQLPIPSASTSDLQLPISASTLTLDLQLPIPIPIQISDLTSDLQVQEQPTLLLSPVKSGKCLKQRRRDDDCHFRDCMKKLKHFSECLDVEKRKLKHLNNRLRVRM